MDISELYQLYLSHPNITTDSRKAAKNSIFLALRGENFDGNKFAGKAMENGCEYAIVDEKEYYRPNDKRYILVEDCLLTYKELARAHRRQFNIPVIGITGTNGKTTTKELLSTVLAQKYNVLFTKANFNNDIGVPQTLFRLSKEHEIAVIEMGASHVGDIKKLVEYVEPTHGLITNVGKAHLQTFGSFEGVKKAKGELYDFLQAHGGTTFVNFDNPHLRQMQKERRMERLIFYGQSDNGNINVCGKLLNSSPYVSFAWKDNSANENDFHRVDTQLVGSYNLDNLLSAVAIGRFFDVSTGKINKALREYVPNNDRSQLEKTADNELIVDTYNANPTSMAAALDNFASIKAPKKMVILGDMLELGNYSLAEHQHIVDLLSQMKLDKVWLVGKEFARTNSTFRKFLNVSEVEKELGESPLKDYCVLIKGSNGIHLFDLPPYL